MSNSDPNSEPTTVDFEDDILPLPNAVGVEYDEETDTVIALVSEKVPKSELRAQDLVSNATQKDTDVIEVDTIEAHASHRGAFRPIRAGVSEGPIVRTMAGTGGPLAKVVNPEANPRAWSPLVEVGEIVRISNAHVYAESRAQPGLYGDVITQPAKLDGGKSHTTVGKLIGYIPTEDGVKVDAAARTTNEHDTAVAHGLGRAAPVSDGTDTPAYPTAVRRDYSGLRGQRLTKPGRTTAVTSAPVIGTSASVNVSMGDYTVLFRDQLLTEYMSEPGDSGSPGFDPAGALTGLLFAGSPSVTVFNKISNVEAAFGLEFLTADAEPTPEPEPEPEPTPEPTTPRTQEITIGPAGLFDTTEYSFAYAGDISFNSRSASKVGQRVNGWVARWRHTFRLNGYITEHAIPPGTTVTLNGTPISPDNLVAYSKRLAGIASATDTDAETDPTSPP